MAKPAGPSKPVKLTRAEKKAARATKRASRRQTWSNVRQAFTLTRQNDSRLIPYLIIAGVLTAAVLYFVISLFAGPFIPIPIAVLGAVVVVMLIFSRRAQTSMFSQAEGTPGAAAWVLQNNLRGDWRSTPAIAGNSQLDAVHRLVGRPGVVLVGEGAPHRVRGLIAQEKRKIARVAGDTPIYDVIVGTDEGEVSLRKLNGYLFKLPRNLDKAQVSALEKRLQALGGGKPPLPQGPMPAGAKMRNVQRTARRRS
ncbi:MAG TPA: DUF4191 domain-containing protein [Jatrophihabitantaceae bacterium]|jgi:hypothetical protein